MNLLPWSAPLTPPALADALAGLFLGEAAPGPAPGGRRAALRLLQQYDPSRYGKTRNFLDAPVSRLSPYLRHGLLSIVEVKEHLQQRFTNQPEMIEEFLRQLCWRDFFEHVLNWHGEALEEDLEEAKHAVERSQRLPLDVIAGRTGLPCMDGLLAELFETGYLHNHARLWFAAYVCHFRGVQWQAGARLFRQYLYDGDLASNSCSWQWVASTFASKPYYMNKENIERYSGGKWCRTCRVKCPFEGSYEELERRLFGGRRAPLAYPEKTSDSPLTSAMSSGCDKPLSLAKHRAESLVWVHDAGLSVADPAVAANRAAPLAFIFDEPALRAEPWAFHRLWFMAESAQELFQDHGQPGSVLAVGPVVETLTQIARTYGVTTIHVTDHPNPAVRRGIAQLKESFAVVVHARPRLTDYAEEPRRFSRYWEKMAPHVLGYRPKSNKRMHQ